MRHLNPHSGPANESNGRRYTPQPPWRHLPGRSASPSAHARIELRERPTATRTGRRRPIDRLTARQLEVLALMAQGHSNSAIARMCYISEKAVVQHTSQIYDRLDLPNEAHAHRRVQAVVTYLAHQSAAA